jgi:hypothetical protein
MKNFVLNNIYDEESNILIDFIKNNYKINSIDPLIYGGLIAASEFIVDPLNNHLYLGKQIILSGISQDVAVIRCRFRLTNNIADFASESVYFDTTDNLPHYIATPQYINNIFFSFINAYSYDYINFVGYKIIIDG